MSFVQERCDRRAPGSRSERSRLSPWIKLGIAGMVLSSSFLAGCSGLAGANPSSPAASPAPQLSTSKTSLTFANVPVGSTSTQSVTLTNTGNATLSISQVSAPGAPFQTSGVTAPTSLAAGQSTVLSVTFAPSSAGSFTGSVAVTSNASTSPVNVALSGSGVASTFQLTASPTSLSFGNVTVGSSASQTVMLTNTGNSSVTISQVSASGAGFSTTGLTAPANLAAGQGASVSVVFAPAAVGTVTGSVSIVSSATNSPAIVTLSGSGVQAVAHSVSLAWDPSTSVVSGYNIYRSSTSGGPFTKLNTVLVVTTAFTDNTVLAGQTYFYATTAVDATNIESAFSNQVSATIPTP